MISPFTAGNYGDMMTFVVMYAVVRIVSNVEISKSPFFFVSDFQKKK